MIRIKKMMCVFAVVIAAISHIAPVFGAFEYVGLGWPAATANIRVLGQHPHHFIVNPALMGNNLQSQVSLSYQNPFQSLDLQAGSATAYQSTKRRPSIHTLNYFGDEHYSEIIFINGSSWNIEKGFTVGLTSNYHRLGMKGFQSQHALTISLGTHAELSNRIQVGSVIEHAFQWEKGMTLPQKFHIGGQYAIGVATISLAVEKESALPLEACLGLLIAPDSFWQIGLGYRDLSGMMSAGWRIHMQRISLYYTCVLHPSLPVSYGFGVELFLL